MAKDKAKILVLLIFDLDPQDGLFSPEKVREMAEYFVESSDMGKLYINYPMVEAFYHMRSIPDPDFNTYTVDMDELRTHSYKTRVNKENRNHDYSKFAVDRKECVQVIRQNIEKSALISETEDYQICPEALKVLGKQLDKLSAEEKIYVLCTCVFYIADYNKELLEIDK